MTAPNYKAKAPATKPATKTNLNQLTPTWFDALNERLLANLLTDIDRILDHAKLPKPLYEACAYAMTGGGKRVRPLLAAYAYLTVDGSIINSQSFNSQTLNSQTLDDPILMERELPNDIINSDCRRAMLAVELLHAYSLIHDDLPALDNDDLRRGRPTCHIQFDEATALLAGDVLQTLAFEVLSADIDGFEPISDSHTAQLLSLFAPRARRMVAGQMMDINAENKQVTQPELEAIHRDKTGALIEAAVLMGGSCAYDGLSLSNHPSSNNSRNSVTESLSSLQAFARHIGLAFQVQDDILDVTASTDELGKPAGSDEGLNKSTYVKLMGVDDATAYAKSLFVLGKEVLEDAFDAQTPLQALADWLWQRKK